jgi:hypothetical protein
MASVFFSLWTLRLEESSRSMLFDLLLDRDRWVKIRFELLIC